MPSARASAGAGTPRSGLEAPNDGRLTVFTNLELLFRSRQQSTPTELENRCLGQPNLVHVGKSPHIQVRTRTVARV